MNAVIAAEIANEIARIVALMGDTQFVLTSSWGCEDDPVDGYIPGGQSAEIMTAEELLYRAESHFITEIGAESFLRRLKRMIDLPMFVGVYNDCFAYEDANERLVSYKLWKKGEQERKRRELEATASSFLRRNSLNRIDCLEAINQLWLELKTISSREEQHFSGECRAERYMSHRMSGASHAFWENEDWDRAGFSADRTKLSSLLEYIQEYFPLLWAEWEAQQGG